VTVEAGPGTVDVEVSVVTGPATVVTGPATVETAVTVDVGPVTVVTGPVAVDVTVTVAEEVVARGAAVEPEYVN